MKQDSHRPLFAVSNHHTESCGEAPAVNGDEPRSYHGYFENGYGEQLVFVYSTEAKKAVLWCGDAGWEKPFSVVDGSAEGLVLSSEEQTWLAACWKAIRRMTA